MGVGGGSRVLVLPRRCEWLREREREREREGERRVEEKKGFLMSDEI